MQDIEPVDETQTEVGAMSGDLRYWLAKEALRQSEVRLAGQATSLQAMETRATSLLTWSVTIGIALVAAMVEPPYRWPALGALVCTVIVAGSCVTALWPRGWFSGGHRPSDLERLGHATELAFFEQMAMGNEAAVERNEVRLRLFAHLLRRCWVSLALAPVLAGAILASALWARL